jgi:hypothetical protein
LVELALVGGLGVYVHSNFDVIFIPRDVSVQTLALPLLLERLLLGISNQRMIILTTVLFILSPPGNIILTDLINTLPGNSSVNTVQHATIEEAVFSVGPIDAPIDWLDSYHVIRVTVGPCPFRGYITRAVS